MRSSKRRSPQPLNFTPDEPPKGRTAPERGGVGPMPKPVSLHGPPLPEPTDALLGVSPATRRGAPDLGLARHAYLFAAVASIAWAGMLLPYTVGYVGGPVGAGAGADAAGGDRADGGAAGHVHLRGRLRRAPGRPTGLRSPLVCAA